MYAREGMQVQYVRPHIGWRKDTGEREILLVDTRPTEREYGERYYATMGPFDTWAGAAMVANTSPNPHIYHVNDAERIAAEIDL